MTSPSKIQHASEEFVYRVVGDSESRLEKRIVNVESRLERRIDEVEMKLGTRIDELDEKQERRFGKVMDVLDSILKQFKKFDEEQTVLKYQVSNHTDRIEKLEKRVLAS